jgi:hypothetical protein
MTNKDVLSDKNSKYKSWMTDAFGLKKNMLSYTAKTKSSTERKKNAYLIINLFVYFIKFYLVDI